MLDKMFVKVLVQRKAPHHSKTGTKEEIANLNQEIYRKSHVDRTRKEAAKPKHGNNRMSHLFMTKPTNQQLRTIRSKLPDEAKYYGSGKRSFRKSLKHFRICMSVGLVLMFIYLFILSKQTGRTTEIPENSSPLIRGTNSKKIVALGPLVNQVAPDEGHEEKAVESLQKQEKQEEQRIVFLVGPHKTGSSSMQTIAKYLNNIPRLNWEICDPWSIPGHENDFFLLDSAKHFAALVFSILEKNLEFFVNLPVDKEKVKMLFHADFAAKWEKGLNMVIGSEEVDSILADQFDGDSALNEMLSIFPKGTRDHTSVIVMYRSPRASHLKSLWKEVEATSPTNSGQSFLDFLSDPVAYEHFHTIDTMALADKFLNKGMEVSLVDMQGLSKQGKAFYQLLICDLMQEDCDADHNPTFLNDIPNQEHLVKSFTESINVRTGGKDNASKR